jgi:hypothetical protein
MSSNTWKTIKCVDGIVTIPYSFYKNCRFLSEQESCSDFKSLYLVTLNKQEVHDAMEFFYEHHKTLTIPYNKLLDYLGCNNMQSPAINENIYKFLKFVLEAKKTEHIETLLLTMKTVIVHMIETIPKEMHDTMNFILLHYNQIENKIRKYADLNIFVDILKKDNNITIQINKLNFNNMNEVEF